MLCVDMQNFVQVSVLFGSLSHFLLTNVIE